MSDRLEEGGTIIYIYETMKKNNLKTFTYMRKVVKV